ncbi:glycosyltransferase family 8 protein [Cylindrobasidium torrendii FP15055 ss-10]|uniref:glycogenin glucosyltransferase n=1 Tax=Cylindrobasidium torrendii FP15055 ss-10 TaxID=1314674 RepID=A0A0D7BGF5_9AGAR|nr:glycosyltransferase family 8 protein [Cylindrobasidium torrendii FP15055 ss-10]
MACPYAFATLLTSDHYLPGALALAAALRDVHPIPAVAPEVDFQTICLVTPETLDVSTIKLLRKAYDVVVGVEVIVQEDDKGLKLLGRLDLRTVLTKLHVFRLTQYTKLIFLDADVLPIRPLSHLFTLPHEFAAVPDVGWPDIFNSGVMVLSPGEDKFSELQDLSKSKGSWDGGDQGLLNEWRGNDWHRLSFTYNTTPTAAYTYAPAYERFGNQIKAIHFIGPNKPWSHIAHRAPFSGQQSHSAETSQVYHFNALLDRWYAVYDRHYRARSIIPDNEFEVRKYLAAWDEETGTGAEFVAAPEQSIGHTVPMGLDVLRRLAIEGMGAVVGPNGQQSGEGEYRSLPLEGRIDLMRPRPPTPPPQIPGSIDTAHLTTDGAGNLQSPVEHNQAREIPSSVLGPVTSTLSLPVLSVTSTTGGSVVPRIDAPADGQQGSHGPRQYHQQQQPTQHAHSGSFHHPQQRIQSLQFEGQHQSKDLQQGRGHSQHDSQQQQKQHHVHQHQNNEPYYPHHEPQQPQPNRSQHQEPQHHQHQHEELYRPPSPPKLSWNPAIEPPPNTAPTPNAFPSDTYFPNIWDQAPSRHNDQPIQYHNHGPTEPTPEPSAFFEPPPVPEIPERLRREGHYRNVTGGEQPVSQAAANSPPKRPKIQPVFPWEGQKRRMPGRVFPSHDAPAPEDFLPERVPEPSPPPPAPSLPSPPPRSRQKHGLPQSLSYANAWDTVPSIQNYATRLTRPAPPPTILGSPFDQDHSWKRRGSGRSREDYEASSMDGDDEDNADDEDAEPVGKPVRWGADDSDDADTTPRSESRRSSVSSYSVNVKGKKKTYSVRGVQTTSPAMRSQGVQVGTTQAQTSPKQAPPKHLALPVNQVSAGADVSMMTAFPSPVSGVRSPREFVFPPQETPTNHREHYPSPPSTLDTTPTRKRPTGPSPSITRDSSMSNTSLSSAPSTSGPDSPADSFVNSPPPVVRKPAGRVFDPARDVEHFKRGSEEVLARFLKMTSWEESPQ